VYKQYFRRIRKIKNSKSLPNYLWLTYEGRNHCSVLCVLNILFTMDINTYISFSYDRKRHTENTLETLRIFQKKVYLSRGKSSILFLQFIYFFLFRALLGDCTLKMQATSNNKVVFVFVLSQSRESEKSVKNYASDVVAFS
jgi:hypothetical protein